MKMAIHQTRRPSRCNPRPRSRSLRGALRPPTKTMNTTATSGVAEKSRSEASSPRATYFSSSPTASARASTKITNIRASRILVRRWMRVWGDFVMASTLRRSRSAGIRGPTGLPDLQRSRRAAATVLSRARPPGGADRGGARRAPPCWLTDAGNRTGRRSSRVRRSPPCPDRESVRWLSGIDAREYARCTAGNVCAEAQSTGARPPPSM